MRDRLFFLTNYYNDCFHSTIPSSDKHNLFYELYRTTHPKILKESFDSRIFFPGFLISTLQLFGIRRINLRHEQLFPISSHVCLLILCNAFLSCLYSIGLHKIQDEATFVKILYRYWKWSKIEILFGSWVNLCNKNLILCIVFYGFS